MNRGDIVWHKFKEPDKTRPVLILTRDGAISALHSVTVAPITSNIRDLPSEVFLSESDGMSEPCVINMDWIQTVTKANLGSRIARLDPERMTEVFDAMKFALGFEE